LIVFYESKTAAGLNYCGALGRRHRLELSMVSPELNKSCLFYGGFCGEVRFYFLLTGGEVSGIVNDMHAFWQGKDGPC